MTSPTKLLAYLLKIGRTNGAAAIPKFVLLRLLSALRQRSPGYVSNLRAEQEKLFGLIGCPSNKAREAAQRTMREQGLPVENMIGRINILAFTALRESGFQPKNILELGTGSGQTSRFLAALFPDAQVHTVDLPDDDPIYIKEKPWGADFHENVVHPNVDLPNIDYRRINTLFLPEQDFPKMDLIWLDAGHEYPEVAWDHFYCVGQLAPGGWLFSDDIVFADNFFFRHHPGNAEAAEALDYINDRIAEEFMAFPKRTEVDQHTIFGKFIGVLHKHPL